MSQVSPVVPFTFNTLFLSLSPTVFIICLCFLHCKSASTLADSLQLVPLLLLVQYT